MQPRLDKELKALSAAGGEIREAEISSVALDDGNHVVGIFGVLHALTPPAKLTHLDQVQLTPRQLDVLRRLAMGQSTRDIAADLHLSLETVRNHIRGILKTLGVHSRIEALARARQLGVI